MKMTKKKVLVITLAAALIAILSMGSLAWFNDTDSVKNTFNVSQTGGKPNFDVTVYEFDENGNFTDEGNTYDDVLPNGTYNKKPYVRNTGSYDQYIRVYVTFSMGQEWKDICTRYSIEPKSIYTVDTDFWTYDQEILDEEANTLTYVYYYNGILKAYNGYYDSQFLFDGVTIPAQFTQADMDTLENTFDIDVSADAMQTENIGTINTADDVVDAKEAFTNIGWAPMTAYDYEPLN